MVEAFEILVRPLLTEKSTMLQEKHNQYQFEVNPKANRVEIKKEIERISILSKTSKENEELIYHASLEFLKELKEHKKSIHYGRENVTDK